MTTQPPLPLIPTGATEIGAAAAMIEDDDGGRVFVHGNLSFAWDAGDTAGRRFAAVSLMRIKAATQVQVAAAFDTSPLTVWRWAQALSAAGVSALVPRRKGPRRASKLTPEVIATIAVLREQGLSLRAIGERVAVSEASVRRALSDTDTETETETDDPTTVSDAESEPETGAGTQPEPVGRPEPVAEPGLGSVSGGVVAVLPDPVDLNRPGTAGDSRLTPPRPRRPPDGSAARTRPAVGVLDRRVESGRVVPVHPGGGFPFQLGPTGEGRMLVDQLRLIQSHSGFHQRVVQGVADAADRPGDPGLAQRLGERDRRVLTARVRVMHQTSCGEMELGVAAGE